MNFIQSHEGKRNWISLTPLIDVVFILLMFFMLTTQFFRTGVMEIAVATVNSDSAVESADRTVRIRVLGNGEWQIDDEVFTALQPATVTRLQSAESVQVQSGAQAQLQDVVSLLDVLSQAGVSDAIWLSDPGVNAGAN